MTPSLLVLIGLAISAVSLPQDQWDYKLQPGNNLKGLRWNIPRNQMGERFESQDEDYNLKMVDAVNNQIKHWNNARFNPSLNEAEDQVLSEMADTQEDLQRKQKKNFSACHFKICSLGRKRRLPQASQNLQTN